MNPRFVEGHSLADVMLAVACLGTTLHWFIYADSRFTPRSRHVATSYEWRERPAHLYQVLFISAVSPDD